MHRRSTLLCRLVHFAIRTGCSPNKFQSRDQRYICFLWGMRRRILLSMCCSAPSIRPPTPLWIYFSHYSHHPHLLIVITMGPFLSFFLSFFLSHHELYLFCCVLIFQFNLKASRSRQFCNQKYPWFLSFYFNHSFSILLVYHVKF